MSSRQRICADGVLYHGRELNLNEALDIIWDSSARRRVCARGEMGIRAHEGMKELPGLMILSACRVLLHSSYEMFPWGKEGWVSCSSENI